MWNVVNGVSVLMWDLTTLLLYLCKIRKIGAIYKSKEDGVWDNVLFILYRIVIITVSYQVFGALQGSLYTACLLLFASIGMEMKFVGEVGIACWIMVFSFSMFMMMDHNTKAYFDFLHFLHRFRLKYLCFCCYHKVVDQQIEHLEALQDLELKTITTDPRAGIESTWFPDLSSHIGADSNATGRYTGARSPKTVTVCDHYYALMQE